MPPTDIVSWLSSTGGIVTPRSQTAKYSTFGMSYLQGVIIDIFFTENNYGVYVQASMFEILVFFLNNKIVITKLGPYKQNVLYGHAVCLFIGLWRKTFSFWPVMNIFAC